MPALSAPLLKEGNHPLENAFSEVTYYHLEGNFYKLERRKRGEEVFPMHWMAFSVCVAFLFL